MGELNWFQKFIIWIFTPRYNCSRGKHKWGYKLSESAVVYLDDKKVPKHLWRCLNCGTAKYKDN